ncbi:MAG: trypsin-like peptidase domain-containing protein [Cyanobacterium sp. T60_A2020_053]|nr:trypsin-like peptidase domain-containing protein [Cyanobacterium sp. T60_A2020_053]
MLSMLTIGSILATVGGYWWYQSQSISQLKNYLLQSEIATIAEKITVKIFANNQIIGGSGVLIGKENNNYYIITNNHVIAEENEQYKIKTHKNKIYSVEIIAQNNQNSIINDLALLKFNSNENYQTIKINNKIKIKENDLVLSAGFPFEEGEKQAETVTQTVGKVTMILDKAMNGGYQFGYTNDVLNGMSGGAILNSQGELVGINGLGKYPALGNPYIYQNGEAISNYSWQQMSELSWGINTQLISNFMDENLINK